MQERQLEANSRAPTIDPSHELPPGAPPHKSGGARIFVWAAILLVFALIFWLVLRHHEAAQSAASSRRGVSGPVTITTAVAKKGNIGVYLDAIGTVTPVYTDSITAEVTGLVTQVHYAEGQLVRKGQAVDRYRSPPLRSAAGAVRGCAGARYLCPRAGEDGLAALPGRLGAQRHSHARHSMIRRRSFCRIRAR